MITFFQLVRPLETVLEREFCLCKRIPGFTLGDVRQTESRILEWHYSRLVKELQDQQQAIEKSEQ